MTRLRTTVFHYSIIDKTKTLNMRIKIHGHQKTITCINKLQHQYASCRLFQKRPRLPVFHHCGGSRCTPQVYSRDPETHISSHRTMTIVCPARSSLATILAKRPRRWSRPSITLVWVSTMVPSFLGNIFTTEVEYNRCLL